MFPVFPARNSRADAPARPEQSYPFKVFITFLFLGPILAGTLLYLLACCAILFDPHPNGPQTMPERLQILGMLWGMFMLGAFYLGGSSAGIAGALVAYRSRVKGQITYPAAAIAGLAGGSATIALFLSSASFRRDADPNVLFAYLVMCAIVSVVCTRLTRRWQ